MNYRKIQTAHASVTMNVSNLNNWRTERSTWVRKHFSPNQHCASDFPLLLLPGTPQILTLAEIHFLTCSNFSYVPPFCHQHVSHRGTALPISGCPIQFLLLILVTTSTKSVVSLVLILPGSPSVLNWLKPVCYFPSLSFLWYLLGITYWNVPWPPWLQSDTTD